MTIWREPCAWKGNLQRALAQRSKVARVEHHAALPWKQIDEVMGKLAASDGTGTLAVRFTALTAARSGKARGATWAEIDIKEKVWTVPAERMKAGREHWGPLSPEALAVLEMAKERGDGTGYVFPGGRPESPYRTLRCRRRCTWRLAPRTSLCMG